MPRLLRRLAAFLEADAAGKVKYRQTKRSNPNERSPPTEKVAGQPSLLARDRKRSLIMDVNPIVDKDAFYISREPPPVLPSQSRQKERVNGRRLMTTVEVEAMASPYGKLTSLKFKGIELTITARMLSSPLRTCLFTRAIIPQGSAPAYYLIDLITIHRSINSIWGCARPRH
jgi:hypothetical protein